MLEKKISSSCQPPFPRSSSLQSRESSSCCKSKMPARPTQSIKDIISSLTTRRNSSSKIYITHMSSPTSLILSPIHLILMMTAAKTKKDKLYDRTLPSIASVRLSNKKVLKPSTRYASPKSLKVSVLFSSSFSTISSRT